MMNNFQSTVPSQKLIIILLDLIANMKHTFLPQPPSLPLRGGAKKRKLLLAGNNFLRPATHFLVLWLRVGSSLNLVKFLAAVAICKLNRKMRGERGGFYVEPVFAGI